MSELTPADVMAMRDDDGLFGGNGGGIIILLLFFLMMGGGYWGNRGYDAGLSGSLTRAEVSDGFTMQNIQNDIKSVYAGMTNGLASLTQTVSNGFANSSQCCCETNRNIDALRYDQANSACAIKNAIFEDGEKTRALLVSQQISDLRDSREATQRELLAAQLTLANASQTQNLLGNLGRFVPWNGCSNFCNGGF